MVKRSFPESLIPPGINDERSRSILKAFEAMACEFDFSTLLMRNSSEMPDEVLPLAVHDFSLSEFIPEDGLPTSAIRKLIDRSWELHEKQGTDEGVALGQELLGSSADITHWWQQEPRGHHDTHEITIFFEDILFEGEPFGGKAYRKAAMHRVEATKRWSQDTAFRFGVRTRASHSTGVIATQGGRYVAMLPADDLPPVPTQQFTGANCLYGGTFTACLEV